MLKVDDFVDRPRDFAGGELPLKGGSYHWYSVAHPASSGPPRVGGHRLA
jgi:hypothetical protein